MMSKLESLTIDINLSYDFIRIVDFSKMLKLKEFFNGIPKCSGCVNSRIIKVSLFMRNDGDIDPN